jgi:uncharacterized protein YbaP (TraB family)
MNPTRNPIFIIAFAFAFGLVSASASISNAATCSVWRVTNAKSPCYLVGTLHALSSTEYPLPAGYQQALHDSKRLVFEMNPESQNFDKLFSQAEVYPKGDDLRRHVHPKTWQIISVNFSKVGLFGKPGRIGTTYVPNGIQQLRPWAIAWTFYGIRGYNDFQSYYGVDNYFERQGRRSGKEFAALETDEEHVEVMRGMNDVESELILLDAIAFRDKKRGYLSQLHTAWRRGDTAGLWAHEQRFRNLDPGADIRLLDARNVKWVPKIRREFNSGVPTSIVVGCGHMVGPNGLIALLQRNGFKFEQL